MTTIFQRGLKNLSWTIMYLVVCSFGLLIVLGVLYAILTSLFGKEATIWADLRCAAGLPSQIHERCWQARLQSREAELARAHEQRMAELKALRKKERIALAKAERREKDLEVARKRLDERLKRAERIEENWSDINLFTMKSFFGGSVHTGVEYPSIVKGEIWDHSWCYFNLPSNGALTEKITLGKATPSRGVVWSDVGDADLTGAKISRETLEAAKALCAWPDGLTG